MFPLFTVRLLVGVVAIGSERNYMKDIEGYEGFYAITEEGRVWSYPKRAWSGGWMKQQLCTNNRGRSQSPLPKGRGLSRET